MLMSVVARVQELMQSVTLDESDLQRLNSNSSKKQAKKDDEKKEPPSL